MAVLVPRASQDFMLIVQDELCMVIKAVQVPGPQGFVGFQGNLSQGVTLVPGPEGYYASFSGLCGPRFAGSDYCQRGARAHAVLCVESKSFISQGGDTHTGMVRRCLENGHCELAHRLLCLCGLQDDAAWLNIYGNWFSKRNYTWRPCIQKVEQCACSVATTYSLHTVVVHEQMTSWLLCSAQRKRRHGRVCTVPLSHCAPSCHGTFQQANDSTHVGCELLDAPEGGQCNQWGLNMVNCITLQA